jgi:polysaccharide export outer membrane protein
LSFLNFGLEVIMRASRILLITIAALTLLNPSLLQRAAAQDVSAMQSQGVGPASPSPASIQPRLEAPSRTEPQPGKGNPTEVAPSIRIGPGDELEITVYGNADLNQHLRVGSDGNIEVPLIGALQVAGMSSAQAQSLIEKRLAEGEFIKEPHVNVFVREYVSEGISIVGEVNRPGTYSVFAAHRLYDLIQSAGGLGPRAGKAVTISHRSDPKSPTTLVLTSDAQTAENNINLLPGDTVVVSKAGIVYVVGEVNRPGGFVMENDKMSALQLLAMAGGPSRLASLNNAKLVRHSASGFSETPLPLKQILKAKTADIPLYAEDIVYVPGSKLKQGLAGTGGIAASVASAAVYRY